MNAAVGTMKNERRCRNVPSPSVTVNRFWFPSYSANEKMEKRKGKGAEESEQSTTTFVVHSRVGQSSKQLCEIRELTKRVEKCFARGRSR